MAGRYAAIRLRVLLPKRDELRRRLTADLGNITMLDAEIARHEQVLVDVEALPKATHPREEDQRAEQRRMAREAGDLLDRGASDRWQRGALRPLLVEAGIAAPEGSTDPCDAVPGGRIGLRKRVRSTEQELTAIEQELVTLGIDATVASPVSVS
jgi:hypothetical protein